MARTHKHTVSTSTSDLSACMSTGHTRKHRHATRTPLTGYTPSTRTHSMSHVSHHTPTHSSKKYTAKSSNAWGQQHLR